VEYLIFTSSLFVIPAQAGIQALFKKNGFPIATSGMTANENFRAMAPFILVLLALHSFRFRRIS
jgi:hypothetical protein